MRAISDIAAHVGTGQFESESHQGETIPSVYIHFVCHSQIHPQRLSDTNGNPNPTSYRSTSLADQHFVPVLYGELFFWSNRGISVLPMLEAVTCVLNSSSTKSTISSRYRPGFSSKYSHKASNIGGVMLRGRPTPFEGAFVVPKQRRFDSIAKTERSLQPTTSAISAGGQLLRSMSRICACCESARFGAILGRDVSSSNTLVDIAIVKRPSGMFLRSVRMLAQARPKLFSCVQSSSLMARRYSSLQASSFLISPSRYDSKQSAQEN
jgi:hypothetical protein